MQIKNLRVLFRFLGSLPHKKFKSASFLKLLDKLSEEELVFLLKIYDTNNNVIPRISLSSREKSLIATLEGYGLVYRDLDSINNALEKVGEALEKTKKEVISC